MGHRDSHVQVPLTQYVTLCESLGPYTSASLFVKHRYLCKALKDLQMKVQSVTLSQNSKGEGQRLRRNESDVKHQSHTPLAHHPCYGHKSITPD